MQTFSLPQNITIRDFIYLKILILNATLPGVENVIMSSHTILRVPPQVICRGGFSADWGCIAMSSLGWKWGLTLQICKVNFLFLCHHLSAQAFELWCKGRWGGLEVCSLDSSYTVPSSHSGWICKALTRFAAHFLLCVNWIFSFCLLRYLIVIWLGSAYHLKYFSHSLFTISRSR